MNPNATPEEQEAAMAAAMAALRAFNIEAFTLLAIAILITGIRTHVRIKAVGFRDLWADDYLVLLGILLYSVETALAYAVGNKAHGLANNSMTPEERSTLQPDNPEYGLRVLGSQIQLAGWATYSTLLWCLKGAMCTFYYRLTKDLQGYRKRIFIGFGMLITTWLIVMLNFFLSCRPFHRMWQISPDPGQYCYPAISPALIWVYLSFNVATDVYLIMIPMPMLWKAAMPWLQKTGLIVLFSLGLFVCMAAILRVVLLVSDPVNGAQLAGSWAVRETFIAVITTNIPMLFPHIKKVAVPFIGAICSTLGISRPVVTATTKTDSKLSKNTTFDTWKHKSRGGSRGPSAAHNSNVTGVAGNESQENIMVGMQLQELDHKGARATNDRASETTTHYSTETDRETDNLGIYRKVEVSIAQYPKRQQQEDGRRADTRSGNYTSIQSPAQGDRRTGERSDYFLDHIHQDAYKNV